jgi:adenylate cyclase
MIGGRRLSLVVPYLGGLGAGLMVAVLAAVGLLEGLEHGSLSRFFEIRGPRQPTAPIVIVSIDESSVIELNQQWPFPRAMHGQLIRRLAEDKPLAIGVDLIFDVPSARGPADDEALGAAVARAGNVILGAAPQMDVQAFYTREDPNMPLPVIRRGAAGVAPVNLVADADSHVRRAPVRVRLGEEAVLGFDAQLHRLAVGAGLGAAPLPAANEILINFNGPPRTFPWVPYYRIVSGEVPPDFFRGKIVLIGPTSEVMHDVFPTAFARGGDMPGVEIHANVLETYVRGNSIREVPRAVSTALTIVAALLGAALVVRLHAARALAAAALLWVILTVFAYLGFLYADVWMRGMAGTLALVLGYGATVVENFVREQREKRRLSQFFSPEVLREVVRHRDEASLGSARRLVTVLFSDLRGFTSLSEKLEPEQVAEMLREYLTEMTEIVFKHGGTVDKYIGDCVMALWNVPFEDPQHAANAVRTGLEFQERTLEVSTRWRARLGVDLRNGVGINTGEAVVGTMGSRQRLEYTAIGDTINLGSRLESITKDYGVAIIISEFTRRYLGDEFLTRELGDVTVKGKTQPVKIYAVLPADIRKHPRAALEAAATLLVIGAGEAHLVTTRDISEGGIAVIGVPGAWGAGTKVEVRCEGGLLPKALVAEGVIAWRREELAGITFAELEPALVPAVADYVTRHGGR